MKDNDGLEAGLGCLLFIALFAVVCICLINEGSKAIDRHQKIINERYYIENGFERTEEDGVVIWRRTIEL